MCNENFIISMFESSLTNRSTGAMNRTYSLTLESCEMMELALHGEKMTHGPLGLEQKLKILEVQEGEIIWHKS